MINIDRRYRDLMYAQYASLQATGWLTAEPYAKARSAFVLHRLRGWLPSNKRAKVLDLGCGPGHVLASLRQIGYTELKGVDLSPEAVHLAQSEGLQVEKADAMNFLRNAGDRFDLVCAFDLLEHFGKDEVLDLLNLIRQRLTPDGALVLQTPNALSPWAGHLRYGDLTHEIIFTPMSIESTLRLCGFRDISIREVIPRANSVKGFIRWGVWQIFWAGCGIWNLAETGSLLRGIYSRNMMVRAVKANSLPC